MYGWCKDGLPVPGHEDKFGDANRNPEKNCCVCGGGEIVETCCQGNKVLEKLKLRMFTKVRMLGHLLAAQTRGNVSWEIAPVEAKLNSSLAHQVSSEQSVLAVASERQRTEGVRAARAAFHDLTQHSEKLPEVAQSQMTIAGYEAGRDEVINGSAQIDDIAVHVAAKDATNHFRGTVQAWERLNSEARVAALRGKERMDTYYDLLNSTWTKIGRSVKVLNSAANQSVEPGEKVRWSVERVRMASELSVLADTHAASLDTQVSMSEDRSGAADKATSANAATITILQGQIDEADKESKAAAKAAATLVG